MLRVTEYRIGGALLSDAAQLHPRDPITKVTDDL